MTRPIVVSLFDESGNMLRPWAEAGYDCYCFDWVNKGNEIHYWSGGCLRFINADLTDEDVIQRIIALQPRFVASFPDCTHLTNAGSRHWHSKLSENPELWTEAVELARTAETIGKVVGCPWFAENPRGKLSRFWRKPDFYFDPWEFGGYLPENDVHPRWPQYLPPRDAYPKGTCIWSGNWFIMPPRQPVDDVADCYPGWKKLGGKSSKTKQIRSETPRGWARGVFLANARWL